MVLQVVEHKYSCALERSFLYHGRMYLSAWHICFHSNVFAKQMKVIPIPLFAHLPLFGCTAQYLTYAWMAPFLSIRSLRSYVMNRLSCMTICYSIALCRFSWSSGFVHHVLTDCCALRWHRRGESSWTIYLHVPILKPRSYNVLLWLEIYSLKVIICLLWKDEEKRGLHTEGDFIGGVAQVLELSLCLF